MGLWFPRERKIIHSQPKDAFGEIQAIGVLAAQIAEKAKNPAKAFEQIRKQGLKAQEIDPFQKIAQFRSWRK